MLGSFPVHWPSKWVSLFSSLVAWRHLDHVFAFSPFQMVWPMLWQNPRWTGDILIYSSSSWQQYSTCRLWNRRRWNRRRTRWTTLQSTSMVRPVSHSISPTSNSAARVFWNIVVLGLSVNQIIHEDPGMLGHPQVSPKRSQKKFCRRGRGVGRS